MEVQELHDLLREDIKDLKDDNRTAHGTIYAELKALNGQVKSNKWSIRAIWTIFGGGWAIFLLWLKSHL